MANGDYFAGRLRELRGAKGLTQTQLAQAAGLTIDGLSRLERGSRRPTWDTVLALAEALGVSTEDFREPPAPPAEKKPRGRPKKKGDG